MRIASVTPNGVIRKNIERPVAQIRLQPSFSGVPIAGGGESSVTDVLPLIVPASVAVVYMVGMALRSVTTERGDEKRKKDIEKVKDPDFKSFLENL